MIILNVVTKFCSNANAKGGIYLIEFCVDDFGVLVPVVDVDPHLQVYFDQYIRMCDENKKIKRSVPF